MKVELIQETGKQITKYCELFNIDWLRDSKDVFNAVYLNFDSITIRGENPVLTEKLNAAFDAHRNKIAQRLTGYRAGTVEFKTCYEALAWAVTWYMQAKISNN